MQVQFLKSDQELSEVAEILLQLRPQYAKEKLIAQIKEQQESGYQIVYIELDGKVSSVAGFVTGQKLGWGKYLYIDDLVTNESQRSTGAGSFLINWFKDYAAELGCEQLHLDSGVQKFPAHRFYLRERFKISSHHFSITDIGG
ncbi:GNAT family N-acetyltransferase [Aliikangiella coralliicola]|uniref:GNAT family N-acetyltransferase n=1 Tax=Aliikangiella coralliicola TaxID=2592383 RepID=A0A545UCA1_9GAMM|nr:GNAT family N-acetyltransferase [Aliikangiella coralliicola]TQV87101.1 GNAT family N-acetyltransferase [Aliikangiella coralliicola]